MIRYLALVLAFAFSIGQPARAAIIDAKYCVDYNLDYWDGATGDLLTGTTTKARGAKLQLERSGGGLEWIYLDWEGADAGCGWFNDISVGTSETFTVRLIRQAYVNGNYLKVYNEDGENESLGDYENTPVLYNSVLATSHHPVHNTVYLYDTGPSSSIHVLAAASWAMQRRNGGVTGVTYVFYTDKHPDVVLPSDPGTSYRMGTRAVYNGHSTDDLKFVTAHELGHAIAHAANEFDDYIYDRSAVQDGCSPTVDRYNYHYVTKEFQSQAITEGLAEWYAAISFNHDGVGADCWIEHTSEDEPSSGAPNDGGINWDADEVYEPYTEPDVFSCESGLTEPDIDIRGYGYIDQFCLSSGWTDNRGTIYDWMRHLWDLTTDYGVSHEDIFEIWNRADPDTWEIDGHGTGGDYPSERMHDAAQDVGGGDMQDDYDACAAFNWAHL